MFVFALELRISRDLSVDVDPDPGHQNLPPRSPRLPFEISRQLPSSVVAFPSHHHCFFFSPSACSVRGRFSSLQPPDVTSATKVSSSSSCTHLPLDLPPRPPSLPPLAPTLTPRSNSPPLPLLPSRARACNPLLLRLLFRIQEELRELGIKLKHRQRGISFPRGTSESSKR